jgi:TPR repeat protein
MTKAAEQGHVAAMLELSELLRTRDLDKSAEWLVQAAATGEISAVMRLALAYQVCLVCLVMCVYVRSLMCVCE